MGEPTMHAHELSAPLPASFPALGSSFSPSMARRLVCMRMPFSASEKNESNNLVEGGLRNLKQRQTFTKHCIYSLLSLVIARFRSVKPEPFFAVEMSAEY